ncbi:MAG: tripartite tricarboxylate transporter substrate binding protein [Betaproteobacteria bacterium]|nr:tripartite tricarboxylate transporter substrate binding protein [Betaproteobacteria bacterium]
MPLVRRFLIALLLVAASHGALAQEYPARPVRIIVPFAPGGATDVPTRLIAPKLTESLGQPFVIENRTGAGGIIGIDAVAKSAPDGYTVLMASNAEYAMHPSIYAKLPYNPLRDFVLVSIVVEQPMLVTVGAASPYATLAALIAAAKAKPGAIAYSTAGTGSTSHVLTELLAAQAGIKLLHVPYKGGAPASTALASGEVAMSLIAMSSVLQFVKGGKAKVLGVMRPRRVAGYPDWPTVEESGVRGIDDSIWIGMALPAAVPREIVARLATEVSKALRAADVRERLAMLGIEPLGSTPEESAARLQRESARYEKVIRAANIRAD